MAEVTLNVSAEPLHLAATLLAKAITEVGLGARVAIPGGSALAVLKQAREHIPPHLWSTLRLTWADERVVPFAHRDSNRGEAYRTGALTSHHPVALELPLVGDGESADDAVRRVSHHFAHDFAGAIDVALLGLGEDGHVASLFPGHPALGHPESFIAIHDAPKPPPQRITMGLSVLTRPSVYCLIVAVGAPKRAAIERVLHNEPLHPTSRFETLTLITDQHFEERTTP